MDKLIGIGVELAQHPITSAVLLCLGIGAAFTATFIFSLGIEYVVVLDKAHLLVLLSFFATVLLIAFALLSRLLSVSWGFAEGVARSRALTDIQKVADSREIHRSKPDENRQLRIAYRVIRKHSTLLYILTAIVCAALLAAFFGPVVLRIIGGISGINYAALGLNAILIPSVGFAIVLVTASLASPQGVDRKVMKFAGAMGQLILLVMALGGGRHWYEYVSRAVPTVIVTSIDYQKSEVRIVAPGLEGILVRRPGATGVDYLPWSGIRWLTHSARAIPILSEVPTPPDTVSRTK